MLQEVHGCGVTTDVRGESLPFERGTGRCGKMGVLGNETLDRIAAESATTDTRKERIFGQTMAFPQPRLEHVLRAGAYVRCLGKGRKQRCTPLRPETATEPFFLVAVQTDLRVSELIGLNCQGVDRDAPSRWSDSGRRVMRRSLLG